MRRYSRRTASEPALGKETATKAQRAAAAPTPAQSGAWRRCADLDGVDGREEGADGGGCTLVGDGDDEGVGADGNAAAAAVADVGYNAVDVDCGGGADSFAGAWAGGRAG